MDKRILTRTNRQYDKEGLHLKSLAELRALRDKVHAQADIRKNSMTRVRVLVYMATCGIAAGARPVLTTLVDEVAKRELKNVVVTCDSCIGICQFEPVVEEIIAPGKEKVTYVKMTPERRLSEW